VEEIQALCQLGKIKWTTHISARLQERGIEPSDIKHCINNGEIIEQYPDDFPHPSCLISGFDFCGNPLHVVMDVGAGYIWLITAYIPNHNKWQSDFKTRKVLK